MVCSEMIKNRLQNWYNRIVSKTYQQNKILMLFGDFPPGPETDYQLLLSQNISQEKIFKWAA